jgi:DNA-binding LytR/AlgR family response regulator
MQQTTIKPTDALSYIYVKEGRSLFQVHFSELQYIEAYNKCLRVITCDRVYLTKASLTSIEKQLPVDLFCRIHRSFIVSFRYAHQLNCRTVIVAGTQLPIGRNYRGALVSRVASRCITHSLDGDRHIQTSAAFM